MGDVYRVVWTLSLATADLEYYTFLEGGQHQTIVWRRHPTSFCPLALPHPSEAYNIQYEQSWADQLPDWYQLRSREVILNSFLPRQESLGHRVTDR